MTLYEFSNRYLIDQTEEFFPDFPIAQLDCYRAPHIFSWPPYFSATVGSVQKTDLMRMLAFILQNRSFLPNVINFENNYEALSRVTGAFDAAVIAGYTRDDLVARLVSEIGLQSPSRSWIDYAEGLIDAANYLNAITPFSYTAYLARANASPETVIGELCAIRGIGPALARNFLKEIGVTQLGKPDVHLYAVFAFDPSVVDDVSFDRSLKDQARKAGVTAFELDRIIWMICSGDYFKHRIKIGKKNLRDRFIAALSDAIDRGIVTP